MSWRTLGDGPAGDDYDGKDIKGVDLGHVERHDDGD